ncbi:unnamed protein product, partial [Closterium sp. NIES-54]
MARRRVGAIGRTVMGPDSQGRFVGGRREGWRVRNAAGEGEGWDGGRAGVAVAQAGQPGGKGGGAVKLAESQGARGYADAKRLLTAPVPLACAGPLSFPIHPPPLGALIMRACMRVSAYSHAFTVCACMHVCLLVCMSLVQLNEAWGGTWPGNTNATTACRQWAGVTCNPTGYVTALQLDPSLVVNGSIPSALVQLSLLRTLNLSRQRDLNGTMEYIPALSNLQILDLRYSQFYGPIPEAIGNLAALSHLDLHTFFLNGTFPSTIGALTRLTYLDLGELVAVTGPFANLTWLSSLTSLRYLSLAHNDMYGELPPLTFSTLQQLTFLDLGSLKFGSFPNWITVLSGLKYLNLHGLVPDDRPFFRTAIVPQDLSKLVSLETFDAAMNGLLGVLPDSWASLVNLTSLTMSSNNISGSIPLSFSNLTNLRSLMLDDNQMSGSITQVLSSNLENLALAMNLFEGPIPSVLAALPLLTG